MASTGLSSFRNLRRIQTLFNSSWDINSSSLRVPERLMSMAGKMRLSASFRSRTTSMLPVPLNSSKMTSSMRLPVSIRAVATMVRLPPFSMLRAAPKNRFGFWRALASTPPEGVLPECGTTVLWARASRGDDQPALPFPDRRQEIHDPGGHVLGARLQPELLLRIERRQVVEEDLVLRGLGRLEVHRLHPQEREVPLAVLGRADLAGDRVAGAEVEPLDLRRRDVDVVRTREIVVVRGTEESVSLGEDLQDPFREDQAVLLGLSLENLEDQLLLSETAGSLHVEGVRKLHQLGNRLALELDDVEALLGGRGS